MPAVVSLICLVSTWLQLAHQLHQAEAKYPPWGPPLPGHATASVSSLPLQSPDSVNDGPGLSTTNRDAVPCH